MRSTYIKLKITVTVLLAAAFFIFQITEAAPNHFDEINRGSENKFATPLISAVAVSGNISSCQGTASANPHLQHFAFSASNLTADVVISAPANFEISTSTTNGYNNKLTITPAGGSVSSLVVYVRSAATAPAGYVTGTVLLSSAGATTIKQSVAGVIFPVPVVDLVANQTVAKGAMTAAVNFTGTADQYTWTNSTNAIGLPLSGMGDLYAFKAANKTSKPITATITVTPKNIQRAYIANYSGNSISVINTPADTVSATLVEADGAEPRNTLVSPDSKSVFVANYGTNAIAVINVPTNKIVKRIPVLYGPETMVATPDGRYLYVGCDVGISIIDLSTQTVTLNIKMSGQVSLMAISPDGSKIYGVQHTSSGDIPAHIIVINTATNAVITSTAVSTYLMQMVLSPDGGLLYLANGLNNNLSIINTATMNIVSTINVTYPISLAINRSGSRLYIGSYTAPNISVMNTATHVIMTTIGVGNAPENLALTPDDTRLYVANMYSNNLSVINTATNTVIDTIPVAGQPQGTGHFITGDGSCPGSPVTFTITVNPAPNTVAADEFDTQVSVSDPAHTLQLTPVDVKVHQALSPNGDGNEDFLQIDNISQYPDNRLLIMNRDGQLIFEAKGYDNNTKVFDGHSNRNGRMQLPGTYFYQLDYTVDGVLKHKTGFIVLKY